jgi:hypothetical protein
MPLTVFDIKGIPGHRGERIEAAVVAHGRHASGPHEAWIAADVFRDGAIVLIRAAGVNLMSLPALKTSRFVPVSAQEVC